MEELNIDLLGDTGSSSTDKLQGWVFAGQTGHAASFTFRGLTGERFNATESRVPNIMPNSGRVKGLRVNVPVNTAAGATTVELRRNGAAILTVVIPAGQVGIFETIATVQLAKDELLNYRIVAGGASSIVIPSIELEIDTI